jgi:hypothetical protein
MFPPQNPNTPPGMQRQSVCHSPVCSQLFLTAKMHVPFLYRSTPPRLADGNQTFEYSLYLKVRGFVITASRELSNTNPWCLENYSNTSNNGFVNGATNDISDFISESFSNVNTSLHFTAYLIFAHETCRRHQFLYVHLKIHFVSNLKNYISIWPTFPLSFKGRFN